MTRCVFKMASSRESFCTQGRIGARKLNPLGAKALKSAPSLILFAKMATIWESFCKQGRIGARKLNPLGAKALESAPRMILFAKMATIRESFCTQGRIGARKLNTLRKTRARRVVSRQQDHQITHAGSQTPARSSYVTESVGWTSLPLIAAIEICDARFWHKRSSSALSASLISQFASGVPASAFSRIFM